MVKREGYGGAGPRGLGGKKNPPGEYRIKLKSVQAGRKVGGRKDRAGLGGDTRGPDSLSGVVRCAGGKPWKAKRG